jgi:glycosyltransferase involved in cell wall biosynthesis
VKLTPRASLIVLAYNEEKYISKCLESLKNQAYRDYELIVINNNSTDNTAKIAQNYTKKIFMEKKKGYFHAANMGVRKAKGKYIAFCDADCIYPKDWLQKVMHELNKNNDIVAVNGSARFYDCDVIMNFLSGFGFTVTMKIGKLLGTNPTIGFNFVMKKDAYIKVGGYNPNIFNHVGFDFELGKRLTRIGKVKLNTNIVVLDSARRYKKDGFIKTSIYMWGAWFRLNFNMKQKMSYETYNEEIR